MLEEPKKEHFESGKNSKGLSSIDSRYKTLFEQVNDAVFLATLEGKILEANLKSCDLLGYSWDEFMNLSLREIFPPSHDWSQLIDEISSKGGLNFEAEILRKDETRVPVDVSTSLFIIDGKPVMLGLIRDVTERKEAEKKLKESEQKYRGLFECTTDGTIILDARGEILDINCRALEMFGLKKESVVGKNFLSTDLLTSKSLPIIVKQFGDLLSNRKATSQETEMADKNGKILNVELSSFFLIKKDTEVSSFVVIMRDISDRKQAEIKLTKEHGLLQALMDNIPDSIYFKDQDNKFVMVNKAKAAHSDVTPEEMIGKTDYDFLQEEQAKKSFEDDKEILHTGRFIINKIEKIENADGSERWLSVTKVPRFDPGGNIIGTVGISRDVTQWKQLESLYKQDQKK